MSLIFQILLSLILFAIGILQLFTDKGISERPRFYVPGLTILLSSVLILSIAASIKSWHDARKKADQSEKEKAELQHQIESLKKETAFIGKVTTDQLRTARYLASLDEDIVTMQLVLSLKNAQEFGNLLPFLVVYELFDLGISLDQVREKGFYHIRYTASPDTWQRGPSNTPVASFKIHRSLENPIDHDLSWLDGRMQLQTLEFPFFDETPHIASIRDLHNYGIRVFLTEKLLHAVTAIHLVVNQIAIFECQVNPDDWVKKKLDYSPNEPLPDLFLPRTDAADQVRTVIDLYGAIPRRVNIRPITVVPRDVAVMQRQ